MTKADRQKIFEKYNGLCAYCGCELTKGWHVDEIEPVRRNKKWVRAHWSDGWRFGMTEQEMTEAGVKWIEGKYVNDGYMHPERLHIDNQFPACASCNINKHSDGLEAFRHMISYFIVTLNRDSVQYKIAKRYGLVQETNKPVVFYFETFNKIIEDEQPKTK